MLHIHAVVSASIGWTKKALRTISSLSSDIDPVAVETSRFVPEFFVEASDCLGV
jgi:hypothetical protein